MNQNRGKTTTGVLLIVIGLLALAGQWGLGDLFGEALVACIGVVFLAIHFVGGVDWAIYPGAFTVTVGAVIFLAARNLVDMEVFWPLFIIAPGVSFLIIRASSPHNQWAVYPGLFVTAVGLVMFLFSSGVVGWLYFDIVGKLWPLALVFAGLILIFKSPRSTNTDDR